MDPLFWFGFNDHRAIRWTVILTSPDMHPELWYRGRHATCRGICYKRRKQIVINTAYSESIQNETVVHEWMHASYRGRKLVGSLEESAVTAMEPGMVTILQQFGLTLPPRPEGYNALARHARKIARQRATAKKAMA